MHKKFLTLFLIPLALPFASCNNNALPENPVVETTARTVTFPEFGNVDFNVTQTEFEKAGFNYGDLINITIFDFKEMNVGGDISYVYEVGASVTFNNVPFITNYNEAGYYAMSLCNYQKASERFSLAPGLNPIKDISSEFCSYQNVFRFTMGKRGGYQETLDLVSCTTKATFEEVGRDKFKFTNIRDVTSVGNIDTKVKNNVLIRGSSPFNAKGNNNNDGRHAYADAILGTYGVTQEISLSFDDVLADFKRDDGSTYKAYKVANLMKTNGRGNCLNTKNLYGFDEENQDDTKRGSKSYDVSPTNSSFLTVGLGSDFFYDVYDPITHTPISLGRTLTKRVFKYIADAPINSVFYLHCDEGKDRTGFFVMVLEALCGVSYKDIVADFMLTFDNYFNFNQRSDKNKKKYDAIRRITISRYVYSMCVSNPDSYNWSSLDADKALKEEFNISFDNEDSGTILKEKAEEFIGHLFNDDVSGAVINGIRSHLAK